MTRSSERTLWLLSALAGAAFFLVAGYYGWAALPFWTLLVLPLSVRKHRQAVAAGREWPAPALLLAWASAAVLSLLAGSAPILLPVEEGSVGIGVAVTGISWLAAILSLGVLLRVTYDGISTPTGAA